MKRACVLTRLCFLELKPGRLFISLDAQSHTLGLGGYYYFHFINETAEVLGRLRTLL